MGQFTKLEPFSTFQLFKLSKLCYHFLSSFENGYNFFDIPSNPPPIAVRNSMTILYINKQKNAKLKRREGSFQLLELFKLCYHLLSSFKNGNDFFFISLAIPRPLRSGINWPIIFFKKITFQYIFNNNKKVTSLYRDIHPGDSWPYISLRTPDLNSPPHSKCF